MSLHGFAIPPKTKQREGDDKSVMVKVITGAITRVINNKGNQQRQHTRVIAWDKAIGRGWWPIEHQYHVRLNNKIKVQQQDKQERNDLGREGQMSKNPTPTTR